jgi:hypothetical protein
MKLYLRRTLVPVKSLFSFFFHYIGTLETWRVHRKSFFNPFFQTMRKTIVSMILCVSIRTTAFLKVQVSDTTEVDITTNCLYQKTLL